MKYILLTLFVFTFLTSVMGKDGCLNKGDLCTCSNTGWEGTCEMNNGDPKCVCAPNRDLGSL